MRLRRALANLTAAVTSAALAGCATAPPGTPGAGVGSDYTPVIDTKGVDQAKYETDLTECRAYAQQLSPADNAVAGAVAGAIFMALISAAAGGNSRYNGHAAGAGAIAGAGGGAGEALKRQRDIIIKCLSGRGYTVLG